MRSSRSVVDKFVTATSRWLALFLRMLLPAGLFALAVFGAVPSTAHAQTIDPATVPPFRSAAFGRLWSSSLAAAGAQGMERTTTAWLALQTGGGAFAIGLVFAARSLPSLLLGLTAGTVADRVDRTHQLLAVAGGALLLVGSFGFFVAAAARFTTCTSRSRASRRCCRVRRSS